MKKGRFLWSAYRITEKQKAGKAQNIKEKQLQNSRNTVSRLHVVHPSSPSANFILLAKSPWYAMEIFYAQKKPDFLSGFSDAVFLKMIGETLDF